jgi:hypothetical protein
MMERKVLPADGSNNTIYIAGIAVGSLAASALFIAGGHAMSDWLEGREMLMQWVFGLALVTIAISQVVKIIRRRSADQLQGR